MYKFLTIVLILLLIINFVFSENVIVVTSNTLSEKIYVEEFDLNNIKEIKMPYPLYQPVRAYYDASLINVPYLKYQDEKYDMGGFYPLDNYSFFEKQLFYDLPEARNRLSTARKLWYAGVFSTIALFVLTADQLGQQGAESSAGNYIGVLISMPMLFNLFIHKNTTAAARVYNTREEKMANEALIEEYKEYYKGQNVKLIDYFDQVVLTPNFSLSN